MIKIKAKVEGETVNYECNIEGTGEDIAKEAASIFKELPKQIEETSQAVFFRFLAEITASGMFGIAARPDDKRRADNAEPVEG